MMVILESGKGGNMSRKVVRLLALFALVGLFLAGCTTTEEKPKTETKKDPYKIGAILSVTGANAPLGEAEKKALLMEVDSINKSGGVDGAKIELILEDDESDPAKAVAAVTKLVKVDKVIAVIGGTGTGTAMAIKPILTAEKVPFLAVAAGNVVTNTDYKWTFRAPAKNAVAAQAALNYIHSKLKFTKIAVLYDSNPFGQDGIDTITKEAPALDMTIVAQEKYETTAADVTAQLTNIKAANPEVVLVWGTNPVPAKAAQTMQQLGMTQPYIGSHGIANAKFLELAGDAANGVVFPAGKITIPASITDAAQKKAVDKFIKDFEAKYNEKPNTFAGHAYDALYILTGALKKSGADKTKLRAEIEKTSKFAGPDGIYTYTSTNHDGLKISDLVMIKVVNGKFTQVK
jgi:branched-chain amino acid transport system substrate-binding protein